MAIKQELNTLLTKKMDRKDFLKHVGIGVVAVTGLTTILKALSPAPSAPKSDVAKSTYGGSAYGGTKTS